MSKQYLGLGDHQLLRYQGIERYLKSRADRLPLLPHLVLREIDAQAKHGKRYKAVARKVREVFQP